MSLYISDCQNAFVSPGGADGYEDEIDHNSGLVTPGWEIACKNCETSCSQINNELKNNPSFADSLGVGQSCGMYAKSCGAANSQPNCPLGSHVEVDECVLNQEDMQEFIRAGQTAKIVGVKCLDTDHELNSKGLCVKKSKSGTQNTSRPSLKGSDNITSSSSSSSSSSRPSHKSLWIGLGAGLGVFLLILLALFLVYRNKKSVAKFFMSSRKRSARR